MPKTNNAEETQSFLERMRVKGLLGASSAPINLSAGSENLCARSASDTPKERLSLTERIENLKRKPDQRNIGIVFLGDTTGSMIDYLNKQYEFMKDTIQRVNSRNPCTSYGFVFYQTHDPVNSTYVTQTDNLLHSGSERIMAALTRLREISLVPGGSSDGHAAVECAIYDAERMLSRKEDLRKRIIINIGDMPPLGAEANGYGNYFCKHDCDRGIDYGKQIEGLRQKGIPVYNALCKTGAEFFTLSTYELISKKTGGVTFMIEDAGEAMKHLTEIIVAHATNDMNRVERDIIREYDVRNKEELPSQIKQLLLSAGQR